MAAAGRFLQDSPPSSLLIGPLDPPTEIAGAALEGLVAQHLRAWIAYSSGRFTLSFWRTKAGLEVDFVLYGEDGFWAFEVKNASRIHPRDVRGLAAFRADYPAANVTLLYRGRERLVIGGVLCVPVDAFLRELRPDRDPVHRPSSEPPAT